MTLCTPAAGTKDGTKHVLKAGAIQTEYVWNNGLWCTPGSRWGTAATMMAVLGWKYLGPSQTGADGECAPVKGGPDGSR